MLFRLHLPAFLLFFVLGLLYVFYVTPPRKVVHVDPSKPSEMTPPVRYEDPVTGECYTLREVTKT